MKKLLLVKMVSPAVVFCVAVAIASPAQTLTTLASFAGSNGATPVSSLIQAIDGSFYGTTEYGGSNNCLLGCGTVFRITQQNGTWTLTTLHSFASNSDSAYPFDALVQAADGNLYGTTFGAGSEDYGTIFKISLSPPYTLSTIYNFCSRLICADGSYPAAGLIQAADGSFYGTTSGGGSYGYGTVFKFAQQNGTWTLTTLHSFDFNDGSQPQAPVVEASDGNLYGTTTYGGNAYGYTCINTGCGTVFKITPQGTLTTLHLFCEGNCTDGTWPLHAGLVQATDGNLYGATSLGGGSNGDGDGTVFQITTGGNLTTLHTFHVTDGKEPQAGLTQATDGKLYGTTSFAGPDSGAGTVFEITPAGVLNVLYTFCFQSQCLDGANPEGALIQATDGNFYGTTAGGGADGHGTVYRLSTGLPPLLELLPTIGAAGTPVTILGTNLTGATSVTFNGTPATIITNTGSAITTAVPVGATTGTVQVMVGGNTIISDTDFQVLGPIQLVSVTPCRVADTRSGNPIQGGTSQSFVVPQLGGCGIPNNAAAYSLNVTVVPHGRLGYLTIWPEGEIQPYVSTMNSIDGRVKANAVVVPSGNNAVSVYVTDTTDVILDIDGYFTSPASQTLQFYPLTPCRAVDTRQTNFPAGLGAPSFGNMETRELPVFSNSPCLNTLTVTPAAYAFNVTVVPNPYYQALNFLTIWPSNQAQPVVSTLNNPTATVVANAAIVPADPENGDVSVFTYNSTDVIVDVNGYFAPAGSGGYNLYPTAPCRAYDSRNNNGQPFMGERTIPIATSPCAPPANAAAYVFNATVAPSGVMPYLTLWPDGSQGGQPVVSTLNAYDGFITSNMAIVPNVNGMIDAYADGLTQLILDIAGYFAP